MYYSNNHSLSKSKNLLEWAVSEEYLGGKAMTLPFFLECEGEGWDCWRGEVVATDREGCAGCLALDLTVANVATDKEVIFFDGDNKGVVLDGGEVGRLGNIFVDIDWNWAKVGLTTRAFFLIPLGIVRGIHVVASVWTREATGEGIGDSDGDVS